MTTKTNLKEKLAQYAAITFFAAVVLPVAGMLFLPATANNTANAATDCTDQYIAYKKSGKDTGTAHDKWSSCLTSQAYEWCGDSSRWQSGTQTDQQKKEACVSWYIDGMKKPRDAVCEASRDPSGNNEKTCKEAARISLKYAQAFEATQADSEAFSGAEDSGNGRTDGESSKNAANTVPQANLKDAEDPALKCASGDTSNIDCDLIKKYLNPIIGFLSAFVGIAVTIGIISGGIRYASASDDPQKSAAGRQMIRNAIIALVAYIFLYAAIKWLVPQVTP
jgi:Type IV secretion system pilin